MKNAASSIAMALLAAGCTTMSSNGGSPAGSRWDLGYRGGVQLGDGEPSNDIPTPVGVFARYRLNEDWLLHGAIEHGAGDFETPHELLGIAQDPAEADIDADTTWTSVMLWAEREYTWPDSRNELFWLAGGGFSSVDADDASGPVAGGGTFNVESDVGTELLASVGGGYRRRLGESWALEALVRYDYHLTDWEIRDTVSAVTGSVDDYNTWALLFGLSYRF